MKQRLQSIIYAWNGLVYALRHEPNMRIHLVAAIAVIVFGFFFRVTINEWVALILSITLVFTVELLNSGIEALSDLVKPRLHVQVGTIKDLMAAVVLTSSIGAAVVGILIFAPHIIELLRAA